MADNLILQTGIEGTDQVASDVQTMADEAAQAFREMNDAFATMADEATASSKKAADAVKQVADASKQAQQTTQQSAQQTTQHAQQLNEDIEKLANGLHSMGTAAATGFKNLLGSFGPAGQQFANLTSEVGKAALSIATLPTTCAEAGGACVALGAAVGVVGGAVGGVIGVFVALAAAVAHVGTQLENLRFSTEGTEEDFAKVEIAATKAGISVEQMTGIVNATRDGFRAASRQAANFADMLENLAERAEMTQARHRLRQERLALGPTPTRQQLAQLQKEEEDLREKAEKRQEKRDADRAQRQIRNLQQSGQGLLRLFTLDLNFNAKEPRQQIQLAKQIGDAEERIEAIKQLSGPDQVVQVIERVNQVLSQTPGKAEQVKRALREAFGTDAARLFMGQMELIKKGLQTPTGAAGALATALGHLTTQQREALTDLDRRMGESFRRIQNALVRIGAAVAQTGVAKAFEVVASVVEHVTSVIVTAIKTITHPMDAWTLLVDNLSLAYARMGENAASALAQITPGSLGERFKQSAEAFKKSAEEIRQEIEKTKKHFYDLSDAEQKVQQTAAKIQPPRVGPPEPVNKYEPVPEGMRRITMFKGGQEVAYNAPISGQIKALGDTTGTTANNMQKLEGTTDMLNEGMKRLGEAIYDLGRQRSPGAAENYQGAFVPGGMQHGGRVGGGGTDTVPAWLTPGEFVVNRSATSRNIGLLRSINAGRFQGGGMVGLSAIAANLGSSGGRGLHPVTIMLPSGRSVGGFQGAPSAIDEISRESSVRRFASAGRRSASEG